jgi:hypothetical protein
MRRRPPGPDASGHVGFTPESDRLMRRKELTLCAISGQSAAQLKQCLDPRIRRSSTAKTREPDQRHAVLQDRLTLIHTSSSMPLWPGVLQPTIFTIKRFVSAGGVGSATGSKPSVGARATRAVPDTNSRRSIITRLLPPTYLSCAVPVPAATAERRRSHPTA